MAVEEEHHPSVLHEEDSVGVNVVVESHGGSYRGGEVVAFVDCSDGLPALLGTKCQDLHSAVGEGSKLDQVARW